jgi:hypothetical protein
VSVSNAPDVLLSLSLSHTPRSIVLTTFEALRSDVDFVRLRQQPQRAVTMRRPYPTTPLLSVDFWRIWCVRVRVRVRAC